MAYRTRKRSCVAMAMISPFPYKILCKTCIHWTPIKPQLAKGSLSFGEEVTRISHGPPTHLRRPQPSPEFRGAIPQKSWLDWKSSIWLVFLNAFRSFFGVDLHVKKFHALTHQFWAIPTNDPSHPWISRISGIIITSEPWPTFQHVSTRFILSWKINPWQTSESIDPPTF